MAADGVNPNNVCLVCAPATNPLDWSPAPGTTVCTAANTCHGPAQCDVNGACPAPTPFNEASEPNNSAASAADLGNVDDCDTSALTINGFLAGNADQDFYKVDVADSFSCLMSGALSVNTGGASVTACLELRCVTGTLDLQCMDGATVTTGPSGVARCCKTGSNPQFTLSHNCAGPIGTPDDVNVVASLSGADPLAECVVYSATLGF